MLPLYISYSAIVILCMSSNPQCRLFLEIKMLQMLENAVPFTKHPYSDVVRNDMGTFKMYCTSELLL